MIVASSLPSRTGSPCSGWVRATISSQAGPSEAGDSGRRMLGSPAGTPGLHLVPAVELADEQQPRLAVLEDLADRARCQRRIERHRNVARHPDGEVRHQPVRRVLGEDADARAGLEAEALQVRGHAPRLVHDLAPREVLHVSAADGLREHDPVGRGALPVVESLERQRVRAPRPSSIVVLPCSLPESAEFLLRCAGARASSPAWRNSGAGAGTNLIQGRAALQSHRTRVNDPRGDTHVLEYFGLSSPAGGRTRR